MDTGSERKSGPKKVAEQAVLGNEKRTTAGAGFLQA